MRRAFEADRIRAAEAATGLLDDGTLMQRAATGLATVCADLLGDVYGSRVALLVGSGGNGGDALFAGAALARRGARVDAVRLGSSVHAAALTAFTRAGGRTCAADSDDAPAAIAAADLVVDGIVGIGARSGLRDDAVELLEHVRYDAIVVAVDVPSGVDPDRGVLLGDAVVADVTVTFGAHKPGLLVDPAAEYAGAVVLVAVGLDALRDEAPSAEALEPEDLTGLLRRPRPTDDKYARGVVGVVAGSAQYGGAGVLAVSGALAAGPGMVRFAGAKGVADAVRAAHPEVIVSNVNDAADLAEVGRVQAWIIGPGGGTDDAAAARLGFVLATDVPVLVDADGLTLLAEHDDLADAARSRSAATVLTPHAGELGRLLGLPRSDIEAERLRYARAAAEQFGATVLLKGSTTVVAGRVNAGGGQGDHEHSHGEGAVRINPRATAWLATAGAGDVLAGVIGALLAAGLEPLDAASCGAWLHAAGADLASQGGPITAREVAEAVPVVVASLLDPALAEESTP